jgi:ABC-type Fe3+-citrate transport system substrate-binding protein
MKPIIITILTAMVLTLGACSNSGSKNEHEGHDMDTTKKQNTEMTVQDPSKEIVTLQASFSDLDVKLKVSIKEIVDHYLHVMNALAKDNPSEAASGGKAMITAIGKLDKSLLTADQKKIYDGVESDLKDHAEHIAKNGDDIKHQRSHFSSMSEDIYTLVKAFGGGRTLYHDHCPMAKDNQGAMWISESKEIKNPYFGAQMPTCGTVEEVIQ